ncbi:zeta toxin family protein [Streptomyces beijiangensis]|uniref:zeta toxin family protein n=1 Tax=Streptomyces beijiangensis TaxID=163361 RepID=UPI0031E23F59
MLSEDESHEVLHRLIIPACTQRAVWQDRPVIVVVGGQPGAGKTDVADRIQAVLDRRGGAVRISRDLYKAAHPRYAELLAADVRTAGVQVRPDTRRWQAAVEDHVRTCGFDAVVESALADPDDFRRSAAAWRQAGARVEVVALATPEAVSQLGVVERFLTPGGEGEGRYVSWENHDTCARAMLQTLAVIEDEQLADRITVVRRDGTVLYDNALADRAWRRRPAAGRVVVRERARPWSAGESAAFRRRLVSAEHRVHREPLDEDRRLAVQRDSARASALAEPVRRITQPTAHAPGVDYHRLSADEHQWVFDELIVPSYLSGVTARPDPQAVYVLGQPGAWKSAASRMVRRAMRPGTTRLVGDDFKAAHPDYHRLLTDNPRGAGAAIRADYRAWMNEAEAYVRARRGDVLIEAAPGSTDAFLRSALAFRQAVYPIELVVLAVREADSRLATARRYARALQDGRPARFTSTAGHDQCFRALADIVEHAPARLDITATTVIRRDGQALLRQKPSRTAARRVAWALAAERRRPYTEQEAAQFLALHQALRRALPQHRRELDAIAALARPLLPARVQPGRIPAPRPGGWPLPLPAAASGYAPFSSLKRTA